MPFAKIRGSMCRCRNSPTLRRPRMPLSSPGTIRHLFGKSIDSLFEFASCTPGWQKCRFLAAALAGAKTSPTVLFGGSGRKVPFFALLTNGTFWRPQGAKCRSWQASADANPCDPPRFGSSGCRCQKVPSCCGSRRLACGVRGVRRTCEACSKATAYSSRLVLLSRSFVTDILERSSSAKPSACPFGVPPFMWLPRHSSTLSSGLSARHCRTSSMASPTVLSGSSSSSAFSVKPALIDQQRSRTRTFGMRMITFRNCSGLSQRTSGPSSRESSSISSGVAMLARTFSSCAS